MDVFECMDTRRSVRKYDKLDVPLDKLVQIIDAGTDAPSAGNTQPWEFIIVTEKKIKDDLYEAALKQDQLKQAPILVAVLANKKRSKLKYGDRGSDLYSIQDTAACIQNMLLAANALGLGGCWIGSFDELRVRAILGIQDDDIKPVAILTIGYKLPYEEPAKPARLEIDKITWAEKYGQKPKWILPPQRKHRFSFEPLDQQAIKAKDKIESKIFEINQRASAKTEKQPKNKKSLKDSFLDFFRKLTR